MFGKTKDNFWFEMTIEKVIDIYVFVWKSDPTTTGIRVSYEAVIIY